MHYFQNFKGFAEAKLNLFQQFTVLIGPNGSGKSNIIEAVELLSFIARGGLLYGITDINKAGQAEVRGGLQSCPRYGKNEFTLGFDANIRFDGDNQPFTYRVTSSIQRTPYISAESLYVGDNLIFENVLEESSSHVLRIRYNNFDKGGRKPQISASPMQSFLSQYKDFAVNNKKRAACLALTNNLAKYLYASFVFDPNPKLMREYERIGDQVLTKNASNISAVLYGLSQGDEAQRESLQRLLVWIRQLPNEPYQDFDFVPTKLKDVIFGLKEAGNGQLISAGLLSDGTLRCLAVLTALETVASGSRIVIEEFDNGLHPSRVGVLVKAIEDCCTRRKLNVLVTTHNPATLNSLSKKQLDGVVLCAWDKGAAVSRLVRLPDLPSQEDMLSRGQLGDLVTREIIDQYLAPSFTEQQKQKGLAWLDDLRSLHAEFSS
jgi:predicted ATPase